MDKTMRHRPNQRAVSMWLCARVASAPRPTRSTPTCSPASAKPPQHTKSSQPATSLAIDHAAIEGASVSYAAHRLGEQLTRNRAVTCLLGTNTHRLMCSRGEKDSACADLLAPSTSFKMPNS